MSYDTRLDALIDQVMGLYNYIEYSERDNDTKISDMKHRLRDLNKIAVKLQKDLLDVRDKRLIQDLENEKT